MNSAFYSSISIVGAAALTIASTGLPTQAEPTQAMPEAVSSELSLQKSPAFVLDVESSNVENHEMADNAVVNNGSIDAQRSLVDSQVPATAEPTAIEAPVPGTVITSASALQIQETDSLSVEETTAESESETDEAVVAQVITPGRATRSGPSYIAVGGNIGFGGRTALGRGNFAITSKIGLTNTISARPGLIVGRSPTILLPVTFDFPVGAVVADRFRLSPFVGGGIAISTRGGSEVRALALGGVDVPITEQFTFTASANAAFFRRPEIGVILGVGYNF